LTVLRGGQPVLETGQPLEQATAAMVLLHGRGASAADIMTVGEAVQQPGFAYLAPQAAGSAWYPNPFTAPLESNEPWLSSALETVERLLERVEERLPASQVILLGFSQGACLALEFAARHARRYGGVVGLSGALIGPDDAPRDYPGSLAGTPVLLGCSDADPYVSAGLVRESGEILRRLGGEVDVRIYPDLGHEVNDDEVDEVREMMSALVRRGQAGGRPSR
jgi:phospholipase/carboxylesterase